MELTIALAITILNCVLGVVTFASNKKKEAIQNTKENHQALIEYQLNELKEDVKTILKKMDTYEKEITEKSKEIVRDEIEKHILEYHNIKKEGK
jgi:hypothetical protein